MWGVMYACIVLYISGYGYIESTSPSCMNFIRRAMLLFDFLTTCTHEDDVVVGREHLRQGVSG